MPVTEQLAKALFHPNQPKTEGLDVPCSSRLTRFQDPYWPDPLSSNRSCARDVILVMTARARFLISAFRVAGSRRQ
jgi:hypothetical protein